MERSLKGGKHLQWREIMAFICRLQGGEIMVHEAGAYVHNKLLFPIYCNPCVMSWSGAHFCNPYLTCSMSDGAKESCDCSLLMSLCGCVVVLQQLLMCLFNSSEKSPSTIAPHLPLPCTAGRSLA